MSNEQTNQQTVPQTANVPAPVNRQSRDITVMSPELEELLHGSYERMMIMSNSQNTTSAKVILAQVRKAWLFSEALQKCSPQSILHSAWEAVRCGLEIGEPLGYAYLIPYKGECTLQISSQGEFELVRRSGKLAPSCTPYAATIRKNDKFDTSCEPPVHTFDVMQERGPIVGFWAKVKMIDGSYVWSFMTKSEVDSRRDRSVNVIAAKKYGKQTPWDTDYEEMAKKTVIKHMTKWMPRSVTPDQSCLVESVQELRQENKYINVQ